MMEIYAGSSFPKVPRAIKLEKIEDSDVKFEDAEVDDDDDDIAIVENVVQDTDTSTKLKQRRLTEQSSKVKTKKKKQTEPKRLEVDMSALRNYSRSTSRKVLNAVVILLTILAMIWNYLRHSQCCNESALNSVENMLLSQLHGQETAIENIVKSINDNAPNKLIFFYGPTGVGKTHASNIILETVQNHYNIMSFVLPSKMSFSVYNVLIQLHLCDFLLIVVDDVILESELTKNVVRDMIASNSKQKHLYIILIFNTDIVTEDFTKHVDVEYKEKLESFYKDIPASKYFIEFNYLKEHHLRQCIEDALLNYNYDVPQKSIDALQSRFNVTFDGCKGVSNKVKYEFGRNVMSLLF